MNTIVVVGDIMVDVSVQLQAPLAYDSDTPVHTRMGTGGGAAGTAAWLARGGHAVRLVAAIGDDHLAQSARAGLAEWGLREDQCVLQVAPRTSTGTCIVLIDPQGERTMLTDPGANAVLAPDSRILEGARHVHVSAYGVMRPRSVVPVRALLAAARARGITTSLDLSSAAPLAQHRDTVAEALCDVTIVLANELEACTLTGAPDGGTALTALAALVPVAVVKVGARGCWAQAGDVRIAQSAPPVSGPVTDTTGAGDALAAGFLPVWCSGGSLEQAVAAGQVLAARTLGRVGAGPGPTGAAESPASPA